MDTKESKFALFLFVRTQLSHLGQLHSYRAKSTELEFDGSSNFTTFPLSLLTAEKEEAKVVLSLFPRKLGLSSAVAARTTKKFEYFIKLLGRELTTLEIRDALVPYLESLLDEHGDDLVDVVENFPNSPGRERPTISTPPTTWRLSSKKVKAIARVSELGSDGRLPAHILYLIELGLAFAYYSLDGKIKPVVELFLDLGIPRSEIPGILFRRPQLCGISLSENLKPTMTYLESLGVDKEKWAKVIYRFPANIGKVLTRCPHIISYSVEDKLKPTAAYFRSLGVDVALLLHRSPLTFGLSIGANLNPVAQFFLDRGFIIEEVGTMISRYGALYTFSLADNLIPKWEFFQSIYYPRSELVKFPQYFGYRLEERIKPRFERVRELGVEVLLNQVLSTSDAEFEKVLEAKKMTKGCCGPKECLGCHPQLELYLKL
ncbi:hypothetical protein AMTRI_Chr06g196340 [Amborella trichopoda]